MRSKQNNPTPNQSPANPSRPNFNHEGSAEQVGTRRVNEAFRLRDENRRLSDQNRPGNQ